MPNKIILKKKLQILTKNFNSRDKSISIRWVLLSSLANGISKAENLLMSEDVMASIQAIRKLVLRLYLKTKFAKYMV